MNDKSVFISYSHDNDIHKEWVLLLAKHLRLHGVDAIIDQWNLRLGDDLPFFMEHGITDSELVICVCSEKYVEKANSVLGGVGYEKMILAQSLVKNSKLEYIIPIIRNNKTPPNIPVFIGSKSYLDFTCDNLYYEKYRELLERIYDQDIHKKPPLGQNPFDSKHMYQIISNIDAAKYISPYMSGKITFRYDNNNGDYEIGAGEYTFKTHWSRSGNGSIHARGKIGYLHNVVDFPEYNTISDFDFSSHTRTIHKNEIVVFANEHGHFAAVKVLDVISSNHGHNYDEMTFEYKIYAEISKIV